MSTDSDLASANPDAAEDINDEEFFPDMTGDESSEADEEDDEEDSERMMKRMKTWSRWKCIKWRGFRLCV
jgi:hypothetical protein